MLSELSVTARLFGKRAMLVALAALVPLAAACGGGEPAEPATAETDPAPAASGGEIIYVTDETGGNVVVVDPVAGTVIDRIAVGKRPRGAHLSADGSELLVALSGSPIAGPNVDESTLPPADRSADGIGVVDLETRTLARVLPSGQDPETFDLSADGTTAYLSNEETAEMSALDLVSGTIRGVAEVGEEPEGVTVRPGSNEVYVTSEADTSVHVVDTETLAEVAAIRTADRPRAIAFTEDGRTAFVSGENASAVSVIDAETREVVATIELPASGDMVARPMDVQLSRDGTRVYVSNGRGQSVSVIDVATRNVIQTIEDVGMRVWGMAVSADGTKLYTANGPSGDVSVIDLPTGTVERRIEVGGSPWGVTVGTRPE